MGWGSFSGKRAHLGAAAFLLAVSVAMAQYDRDFSGTWRLDPARSKIADTSVKADTSLRVEQSPATLTVTASSQDGGPAAVSIYSLDGRSEKYQTGDLQNNTAAKWEGAALLVNTIVDGPASYSVVERWERSNDGNTLTITRNVVRTTGETESVLVYANTVPVPSNRPQLRRAAQTETVEAAQALVPRPAAASPTDGANFVVASGTHILLRLINAVNTKTTVAGDRIYLETAVPVFVNGRLVIPVGAYVNGTVAQAQAGKTKGKSSLTVRFESLTLRSGIARDLRSRPDSADSTSKLDRTEGRIDGNGKNGSAGQVIQTTAAGTGIGAIAGSAAGSMGMGAGIGAVGGAFAGLARVLSTRNPDVMLPRGTTMDMVLDRDLHYTDDELRVPVQ